MTITAQITHTQTGEARTYQDTFEDAEQARYMFEEGVYDCNCQRDVLYRRAKGEQLTIDDAVPCGEGLYTVTLMDEAGETFYSE